MDIEQVKRIQDRLVKTARALVVTADLVAKQQPDDLDYLEEATGELQSIAELLLRIANGCSELDPTSGSWPALFASNGGINRSQ
jgi:hypothetical protein